MNSPYSQLVQLQARRWALFLEGSALLLLTLLLRALAGPAARWEASWLARARHSAICTTVRAATAAASTESPPANTRQRPGGHP